MTLRYVFKETWMYVTGTWTADADREHDPALRKNEGGLVDQHSALQPWANQARGDCRQDGVQEEPRPSHASLPQGRAGETAQLPQGQSTKIL